MVIKDDGKGMCWLAWDKVCKPKNEGRLGINNLQLFNIALLSYRYGAPSSIFLNGVFNLGRRLDSLWWRNLICLGNEQLVEGWFETCVRRGVG